MEPKAEMTPSTSEQDINNMVQVPEAIVEDQPKYDSSMEETEAIRESERLALAKVIDLRNPDLKVAFHTLAYGGENIREFLGGLLYSEQVLDQGLLSKRLADRAEIKTRSAFGYSPAKPLENTEIGISAWTMDEYLRWEKYAKPSFRWTLIINGENAKLYNDSTRKIHNEGEREMQRYWGYDEITFADRVKPDRIIGIQVARELLDIPLVEGLEQIIARLQSGQYYQEDPQTKLSFTPNAHTLKLLRRISEDFNFEFSAEEEKVFGDIEDSPNQEQELNIRILRAIKLVTQKFREHPNFPDAVTVDDYLRIISQKKALPIYTSGGDLRWPQEMTNQEIKEFISNREQ